MPSLIVLGHHGQTDLPLLVKIGLADITQRGRVLQERIDGRKIRDRLLERFHVGDSRLARLLQRAQNHLQGIGLCAGFVVPLAGDRDVVLDEIVHIGAADLGCACPATEMKPSAAAPAPWLRMLMS